MFVYYFLYQLNLYHVLRSLIQFSIKLIHNKGQGRGGVAKAVGGGQGLEGVAKAFGAWPRL